MQPNRLVWTTCQYKTWRIKSQRKKEKEKEKEKGFPLLCFEVSKLGNRRKCCQISQNFDRKNIWSCNGAKYQVGTYHCLPISHGYRIKYFWTFRNCNLHGSPPYMFWVDRNFHQILEPPADSAYVQRWRVTLKK